MLKVRLSPSASLPRRVPEVGAVPSWDKVALLATGASLTAVMVMLTVASVLLFSPSLTVKLKLSLPL